MTEPLPRAEPWIAVNGEVTPLRPGAALADVLDGLHVDREAAVAVAVNDRVIRKAEWATLRLASGDRIEIVRPMQGG